MWIMMPHVPVSTSYGTASILQLVNPKEANILGVPVAKYNRTLNFPWLRLWHRLIGLRAIAVGAPKYRCLDSYVSQWYI